ncbi:MAG: leucine-rich repeat domain-containing protein, partial [Clostridiales bacterium]|nr:leucine-rich repeat domain-containing protein [Clostridiales bacterium]
LVISLMPVFRLASVNGTYYASIDGEISEEAYFKLYAGKWTSSDGGEGKYNILGDELLMNGKDSSEQPLHYHATVKNGLLMIEGAGQEGVFVSERHEHEYGDWFTMEEIDGRWVTVERISNCNKGGLTAQMCACGARVTNPIQGHGHSTYTETVKIATCGVSGEEVTHCHNCDWTESKEIAPTGIHAEYSQGVCTDCGAAQLKYELSEDGTHYIVTGFAEGAADTSVVVILESYEGLPVTEVASRTFYGLPRVMNFEIPASITKIGDRAFGACVAFSTMRVDKENPVYHSAYACLIETESKTLLCGYSTSKIPDDGSVTKIADYAFQSNSALRSFEIPDCVTEIGAHAFQGCTKLKSVKLPSELTTISDCLFFGCSALERITIPNGVTSIGESAFSGCSQLASVSISQSVIQIARDAFVGCEGLAHIEVAEGNPVYHSGTECLIQTSLKTLVLGCYLTQIPADGSVVRIGDCAFENCVNLSSIIIPKAVTEIGASAFAGCINMTSVEFKNSALAIGQNAFSGCWGLETIYIAKDTAFQLNESTFVDCTKLNDIYFDGTAKEWEKIEPDVYGLHRQMNIHCKDWTIMRYPKNLLR